MNKEFFTYVILSTCLVVSCGQRTPRNQSERYMTTANIETVESFPKKIDLPSPQAVKLGALGMTEFKILDSVIVVSMTGNKGLLAFYNKDNLILLGRFLNTGNSKEEVPYSPILSTFSNFYMENDSLYADIFDGSKGRLLTFNVDESLKKSAVY